MELLRHPTCHRRRSAQFLKEKMQLIRSAAFPTSDAATSEASVDDPVASLTVGSSQTRRKQVCA